MRWIKTLFIIVTLLSVAFSSNRLLVKQANLIPLNRQNQQKILSGLLLEKVSAKRMVQNQILQKSGTASTMVVLYFSSSPSEAELTDLNDLGVECFRDTWTPPLDNHPFGYMIARIPVQNFESILSMNFIKKMDTAERTAKAQNNDATMSVRANMLWDEGYEGTGVKIGILDSGIDLLYMDTDLPGTFDYKNYANYPDINDDVANYVTGHGTHVAASALGRGVLSAGHKHWNNGKGPFKGAAPSADLCFLKIGNDSTASSSDAATIAAIDAAVNIYQVDLLSMSYGGWEAYHDGSSALDQKVDWAFEQGVPFFCSAGNSANDNLHWSGTIPANSSSDFIQVDVDNAGSNDTRLRFNLVWFDGSNRNELSLNYYNSSKELMNDVTTLTTTESPRGTESQISYSNSFVPSGDGTYYIKVVNNSGQNQLCHVYEDWSIQEEGTYAVSFTEADPFYTVGSPSTADHCMSVGAYVSKVGWTDPSDNSWWYGPTYVLNDIATFSSRGPRVDGAVKPNICAPGHVLISLRDTGVYTVQSKGWIDNDGVIGSGDANYYRNNGTSMACPIAAGTAALYLQMHPGAAPQDVYDAMMNFANPTGIENLPNGTWGHGRLDIFNAAMGRTEPILVDGRITDEKYETLATFNSGRNGMGDDNDLGVLKFYSDGHDLYIGITGEVTSNDNICLFMDFSGYSGRGDKTLGGGNSGEFVYNAFAYMGNVRMDLDADFALAFNEGNSTQYEFFADAIRYMDNNLSDFAGKTNQYGFNGTCDIGSIFGGTGKMTVAYDNAFATDNNRGLEMRIPISSFAGVDTSQTLKLFVVLSGMSGTISNECIPGDPGENNLGDGADFASIAGQDFFTQPVKISGDGSTAIDESNNFNMPLKFALNQNYPNPFNPSTTIEFSLPNSALVTLKVYDLLGREVATLIAEKLNAGSYKYDFNAENLSSGVYLYKIEAGNYVDIRKMILLQ